MPNLFLDLQSYTRNNNNNNKNKRFNETNARYTELKYKITWW